MSTIEDDFDDFLDQNLSDEENDHEIDDSKEEELEELLNEAESKKTDQVVLEKREVDDSNKGALGSKDESEQINKSSIGESKEQNNDLKSEKEVQELHEKSQVNEEKQKLKGTENEGDNDVVLSFWDDVVTEDTKDSNDSSSESKNIVDSYEKEQKQVNEKIERLFLDVPPSHSSTNENGEEIMWKKETIDLCKFVEEKVDSVKKELTDRFGEKVINIPSTEDIKKSSQSNYDDVIQSIQISPSLYTKLIELKMIFSDITPKFEKALQRQHKLFHDCKKLKDVCKSQQDVVEQSKQREHILNEHVKFLQEKILKEYDQEFVDNFELDHPKLNGENSIPSASKITSSLASSLFGSLLYKNAVPPSDTHTTSEAKQPEKSDKEKKEQNPTGSNSFLSSFWKK